MLFPSNVRLMTEDIEVGHSGTNNPQNTFRVSLKIFC